MPDTSDRTLSRREFLVRSVVTAAGAYLSIGLPTIDAAAAVGSPMLR